MMRVRLKADGRIVELLPDGSEQALENPRAAAVHPATERRGAVAARATLRAHQHAAYARSVRAHTNLTQAQFAARIGVPIETVRNWEQGKRSPRGPARALLKLLDKAPDVAFAILDDGRERTDG